MLILQLKCVSDTRVVIVGWLIMVLVTPTMEKKEENIIFYHIFDIRAYQIRYRGFCFNKLWFNYKGRSNAIFSFHGGESIAHVPNMARKKISLACDKIKNNKTGL